MNRRGFLRLLCGAATTAVLKPVAIILPSLQDDLTVLGVDYVMPLLTDNFFKPSPLFVVLMKEGDIR